MRGKQKRGDVKFNPVPSPCGLPGVRVQQLAEGEHKQEETTSARWRAKTVTFSPALSPCGLPGDHVQRSVVGEHNQDRTMRVRYRRGDATPSNVLLSVLRAVAVSIHRCD